MSFAFCFQKAGLHIVGKLIAWLRLSAAALGVAAVIATFADTASRVQINPFNFFLFFTMQSNIIWFAVMVITSFVVLRGTRQSEVVLLARGCATTYMILVGAIYNTLLVGQEGGVALVWANSVLHIVLPIYAALDWIVFADRRPMAWRCLWVSLVYPMVWVIIVLIRGATDGWVPYPFFNPDTGYGLVFTYVVGIAVLTVITAAFVWVLSRLKLDKVEESTGATTQLQSVKS